MNHNPIAVKDFSERELKAMALKEITNLVYEVDYENYS